MQAVSAENGEAGVTRTRRSDTRGSWTLRLVCAGPEGAGDARPPAPPMLPRFPHPPLHTGPPPTDAPLPCPHPHPYAPPHILQPPSPSAPGRGPPQEAAGRGSWRGPKERGQRGWLGAERQEEGSRPDAGLFGEGGLIAPGPTPLSHTTPSTEPDPRVSATHRARGSRLRPSGTR